MYTKIKVILLYNLYLVIKFSRIFMKGNENKH